MDLNMLSLIKKDNRQLDIYIYLTTFNMLKYRGIKIKGDSING